LSGFGISTREAGDFAGFSVMDRQNRGLPAYIGAEYNGGLSKTGFRAWP
jgi:hypothetical protein